MPKPFAQSAFDAAAMADLQAVFNDACTALATRVTDANREQVQEAIGAAIFELAKRGQTDPMCLLPHAVQRGTEALAQRAENR